jgi:hypothetical protein
MIVGFWSRPEGEEFSDNFPQRFRFRKIFSSENV